MTKTPAMPERFTKKPVTIEAFQFKNDGSSYALIRWINEGQHAAGRRFATWRNDEIIVPTLEGEHIASVGDWIIKGVKGEFYPCKPDIFGLTYDLAALQSAQPAEVSDESAYNLIDRFLRNNLHDDDYAEYSQALDILALRPQAVPMTDAPVAYFSYGEDSGYLEHVTAEDASKHAREEITAYRSDAMHDNEWPSEVDSVCWGVVLQKATAVDNSEEAGRESFDYELGPHHGTTRRADGGEG